MIVTTTATVLCALQLAACGAAPVSESINVFSAGQDGVHTYRIPGVVVSTKGTILAFCEARKLSLDDGSPTDLVLKRSFDGGRTWGAMQTLVTGGIHYLRLPEPDVKAEAIMDPCPVVNHADGTIWLNCTRYLNRKIAASMFLKSTDDGATWSKPVEITGLGGNFSGGPGMGIQVRYDKTHRDRLVVPGRGQYDESKIGSFVLYSDDHGRTWRKGGLVPGVGGGECQIVERVDGALVMNIRSGRKQCRVLAVSTDGGETWGEAYDEPQLPEYGCQASVLRYTDAATGGRSRMLFSNPDTTQKDRVRMTVRLSYDDGKTWPVSKLLHPGPSAYSNLAVAPDGTILCFYEGGQSHRREWIRVTRFSLQWLTDGADSLPSR